MELLRQFTDLQGTKVRIEGDLTTLQGKMDLLKAELDEPEERR